MPREHSAGAGSLHLSAGHLQGLFHLRWLERNLGLHRQFLREWDFLAGHDLKLLYAVLGGANFCDRDTKNQLQLFKMLLLD